MYYGIIFNISIFLSSSYKYLIFKYMKSKNQHKRNHRSRRMLRGGKPIAISQVEIALASAKALVEELSSMLAILKKESVPPPVAKQGEEFLGLKAKATSRVPSFSYLVSKKDDIVKESKGLVKAYREKDLAKGLSSVEALAKIGKEAVEPPRPVASSASATQESDWPTHRSSMLTADRIMGSG
jgi:hypothetical protein